MTAFVGPIQHARDTAANWSAKTRLLLPGELGIETDSGLFKIGDGVTPWTEMPYAVPDRRVVPMGDAYVLNALDFLNERLIMCSPTADKTVLLDTVALPDGRHFMLSFCRANAFNVRFVDGTANVPRGGGLRIANEQDVVGIMATSGGTVMRVVGNLAA